MLEKLVMLQSYGYVQSGEIGSFLNSLAEFGFFSYILPFLLIFALVFGILTVSKIFKESPGINAIISVVIGLMALQFDLVPLFFAELFPRLGVGLGVILVVLILTGIFSPKQSWVTYTLYGIAVIILIIILVKTAGVLGWQSGQWWADNWQAVAGAIFILIVIGTAVGSSNPNKKEVYSPVLDRIFGTGGEK